MIKTVALIARKRDLSREEFGRHWIDIHAPLVRALPGLRRYVQDHVISDWDVPDVAPIEGEIDGIAELWFDDRDAMARAYASPEAQALAADGALFIERISFYVIDERTIVPTEG